MKRVKDFSDRRNKAWCIHCNRYLSDVQTSADHVPTKACLRSPSRTTFRLSRYVETAILDFRRMMEGCRTDYAGMDGVKRTLWTPDNKRIESVVLKNACGHAHFELGEPLMQAPSAIGFLPFEAMQSTQRDAFESRTPDGELAGWPEVGSRLLTRTTEGQDFADGWVIVQPRRYRYSVRQDGCITVRSVWSEYLATEALWDD